jgi:hypothetical protein
VDRHKDTKDRIKNTNVRNPKTKPKRLNLDTNNNMYSIDSIVNTEYSIRVYSITHLHYSSYNTKNTLK